MQKFQTKWQQRELTSPKAWCDGFGPRPKEQTWCCQHLWFYHKTHNTLMFSLKSQLSKQWEHRKFSTFFSGSVSRQHGYREKSELKKFWKAQKPENQGKENSNLCLKKKNVMYFRPIPLSSLLTNPSGLMDEVPGLLCWGLWVWVPSGMKWVFSS